MERHHHEDGEAAQIAECQAGFGHIAWEVTASEGGLADFGIGTLVLLSRYRRRDNAHVLPPFGGRSRTALARAMHR
jgi:hypothetical protein